MLSTSTIKNDPDWEGLIEIKYENIPEYRDIKEIKEEPVDCHEFKIEKHSVDGELEDLPQECIKDNKDPNGGGHEHVDCSDTKCLNGSILILCTNNSLDCQYSEYNYDDVTNMESHLMVAHNLENECSVNQNIPSSDLASDISSTNDITLKTNSKHKRVKICKCEHCDFESDYIFCLKRHINTKHSRQKIHNCQYCGYRSPLLPNLKSHINSLHTREKIYKCDYCDYRSTRMSNVKRHINSLHTREEIHKCEYCEYGCFLLSTLKNHVNSIHTKTNIYQ